MNFSRTCIVVTAVALVALACGRQTEEATDTAAPVPEVTETTPAPAQAEVPPRGEPMKAPEGADQIQLTLTGGPDEGQYIAFYEDRTPLCYPGRLADLNVSFTGSAEGTKGSSLVSFSLISTDPGAAQTSAFVLETRISLGLESRTYELVPEQGKGSGALSVARSSPTRYDIQIQGNTAGKVTLKGTIICHN